MSRRVKELLTDELRSRFADTPGGTLVDLTGLDAIAKPMCRPVGPPAEYHI